MKRKKRFKRLNGYPLLSLENYPTNTRYAEAFRTLRSNIHFSFMDKQLQSLLITSAGQSEGKTSSAFNLGQTMSRAGKSVLLIDADLRKPMLSRINPGFESLGLTGLLSETFSTPVKTGRIDAMPVGDLLRLLMLQKQTGRLCLENESCTVEILFSQGHLKDAQWLNRPANQKLAAILVKGGQISEQNIRQALERQKGTGQKLGFILINMGLLSEKELTGPLTIHMLEGLRVALQMEAGTYSFKELSAGEFERTTFDPAEFDQVHRQALVGEEHLPWIQNRIEKAIESTSIENLYVLPAGSLPANPTELLGSDRMSFLIGHLKRRYDVLIIDTPPILPVSDALLLAPQVDGVLMVIKAGLLNRELVKNTVEQINRTKANLVGVVLNQVDVKREGYYKYYHKYYASYYGDKD